MKNGRILCKGNGLKIFFEIPMMNKATGRMETLRYQMGNISSIFSATNRAMSHSYITGKDKAIGVNKGIRNSYGRVVFTQLDADIIDSIYRDVKSYDKMNEEFVGEELEGFILGDVTTVDNNAPLVGRAEDQLTVDLYEKEVTRLSDLPPVNIVVLGNADNIDEEKGVFEPNTTYEKVIEGCTFLSDTFGITAGGAMHDSSANMLILGDVYPWRKSDKS